MIELSYKFTKKLTHLLRILLERKKCKELDSLHLLFIFYQHLSNVNMECLDSSIGSTLVWNHRGSGFKSRQGRE